MTIRVLLADDHPAYRDQLTHLLNQEPDMRVVGTAENGLVAVLMAQEILPDIVLIDIAMPLQNGIEATRRIVSDCPSVKVIALSVHSDRRIVEEIRRAGALGYVQKDHPFPGLVRAIRAVHSGKKYFGHADSADGFEGSPSELF